MVPVGLKPPLRVAESVIVTPEPNATVPEGVVVIPGLAGLTVTGSDPFGLVSEELWESPL